MASKSIMPLTDRQRADFDRMVHSKPVVLFMKGNRRFPACGFSATVVGILDKLTSGYETVNILEDSQVREGMKEFSSWPTFPQLYVKGEFVGGCDIVKEMYASGELQKLLGAEPPPVVGTPRVTISPAAAKALLDAAGDAGGDVIRLAIDSDFRSDLQIAPKEKSDIEVSSNGAVLYLERGSAARADGIRIDFVESPGGMAFKIDNPNEPPHVKGIAPKELKSLLDLGRIALFDVRPAAERAVASIAQARALDDEEGRKALMAMKRDSAIALHCHHGVRSRAAAEGLLREGFTNVYNLEGGIEAWSRDVDSSVPRY
jgi:monothiol glutaredoxin